MTEAELPPGWAMTTVGVACSTQLGKMLSKKAKSGEGELPYLRNQNVQWGRIDLDDLLTMNFSDAERVKFGLRPGDVLVCEGGVVGRAAVWRSERGVLFQKALHRLRCWDGVSPEWVAYAFQHMANSRQFGDYTSGSTIAHLPQEDIRRLPLALPPTDEQDRIVTELERRLSHVDAAERGLTSLIEKLAVVRSAIINSAMTGSLVAVGGGNATADAEEDSDPGDTAPRVPPHWRWSLLKDILREPMRNGRSAPTAPAGSGVRVYAITAVTRRDWGLHHTKWAEGDPAALADLFVKDGDVFVQRSNTPELVGTSALYRGPDAVSTFPDLLIRLRPSDEVAPEWLEAVLLWSSTRTYLRSVASGLSGSMPKIDQGKVGKVRVPIPPLDEQLAILAEMNRRLSLVDAAVRAVQNGLGKCTQVRKSVLAAAFTGQLSTQDAREEPACVLLDRIKGQRQAAEPARKPGRKPRAKKETT